MSAITQPESSQNLPQNLPSESKSCEPHSNSQDAWTAARCERILMDLHAKIDAVQIAKNHEWASMKANMVRKRDTSSSTWHLVDVSQAKIAQKAPGLRSDLEGLGGPELGAEWHDVPHPTKRAINTYTAKLRKVRRPGGSFNPFLAQRTIERPFSKAELEMPLSFCKNQTVKAGRKGDSITWGNGNITHENYCPKYRCLHTFSLKYSKYGEVRRAQNWKSEKVSAVDTACESLYDCISALLDNTMLQTDVRRVGAPSLFSTSLRKISEDAAAEEKISRDKDYSISHVFKDLEDFFSSGASGWPPLREFVRHCAMHVLSNRISKNNLRMERLLDFLLYKYADEEAKILYDSALNHIADPRKLNLSVGNFFLSWNCIESFAEMTEQQGYAYQRMVQLLEDFRMETTCLESRRFISCLNGAVAYITNANDKSIPEDHIEESGALVLRTAVRQSYLTWIFDIPDVIHNLRLKCSRKGVQQEPSSPNCRPKTRPKERNVVHPSDREARGESLEKVTFNALAILLATEILQHKESMKCGYETRQTKVFYCLQQMGLETRQYLRLREIEAPGGSRRDEQLILPLLAAGLAFLMVNEDTSSNRSLFSVDMSAIIEFDLRQSALKRAGSFLSKVALHCTQATGAENEFTVLQDIFSLINNAREASGRDPEARRILDNIKIAAAFSLCHESNRPDRQEWTMRISEAPNLDKVAVTTGTPPRKIARYDDGYRWEEGISEWVERTPVPLADKPSGMSDSDGEDCFGIDSPTKQPKKMKMPKPTNFLQMSPILGPRRPAGSSKLDLTDQASLDFKAEQDSMIAGKPAQLAEASQASSSRNQSHKVSPKKVFNHEDDLDELSISDESIYKETKVDLYLADLERKRRERAARSVAGEISEDISKSSSRDQKRRRQGLEQGVQKAEEADELG